MHNHNLERIYSQRLRFRIDNLNTNNNYVDLQHVTNLGLCNKFILVTQKQVLELYITAIECKTLYSLCVPHTTFPNAARSQLKQQKKKQQKKIGPCYQDRSRELAHAQM